MTQKTETISDLGPTITTCRLVGQGEKTCRLLVAAIGLIALASLVNGLTRAYYGYTQYGPIPAIAWSSPWFFGAVISLVFCLVLILITRDISRRAVSVHKNGLQFEGFRAPQPLEWKQISGIAYQSSKNSDSQSQSKRGYQARLYLRSGKVIDLSSTEPAFPDLISRIKASIYPTLYTELHNKLQQGILLPFDLVSMHKEGLQMGKNPLTSWNQIKRITIKAGFLVVELNNHGTANLLRQFPTSRVPNLELLLKLIDQATIL